MRGKATVSSPSNIAFVKYWGARDLANAIPCNRSVSMTLSRCVSRCTVELVEAEESEILFRSEIDGELRPATPAFASRVQAHLDRLGRAFGYSGGFRVATENSFPSSAGIASSASGLSALTYATHLACGRNPTIEELSDGARASGSGSAARSVMGGYVEWPAKSLGDVETWRAPCFAAQVAPADHWALANVVVIVETGPKKVSSLDGHQLAPTSPYFQSRLQCLEQKVEQVKEAIELRSLDLLGPVIEAEAIDLHCIAMTSNPAVYYWTPATLRVLEHTRLLRSNGIEVYATMDAGANVHLICEPSAVAAVSSHMKSLDEVEAVIEDRVGDGPRVEETDLI